MTQALLVVLISLCALFLGVIALRLRVIASSLQAATEILKASADLLVTEFDKEKRYYEAEERYLAKYQEWKEQWEKDTRCLGPTGPEGGEPMPPRTPAIVNAMRTLCSIDQSLHHLTEALEKLASTGQEPAKR